MGVQILCDSRCDLTATERMSSLFQKVPATWTLGERPLTDHKALGAGEILEAVAAGAAIQEAYPGARAYREAMGDGEIYIVTASAALCGQYEAASQARRLALGDHPGQPIHVFNTRSFSVGQLLAARRICQLQRSGYSFRQIVERVESEILSTRLFLLAPSPERLLQWGGLTRRRRERPRPLYTMNLEGRLVRAGGALTDKGAEKRLAEAVARSDGPGKTCLLAHCGCPERARRVAQLLREQQRFSSILLTEAGAATALLLGPGGLALSF